MHKTVAHAVNIAHSILKAVAARKAGIGINIGMYLQFHPIGADKRLQLKGYTNAVCYFHHQALFQRITVLILHFFNKHITAISFNSKYQRCSKQQPVAGLLRIGADTYFKGTALTAQLFYFVFHNVGNAAAERASIKGSPSGTSPDVACMFASFIHRIVCFVYRRCEGVMRVVFRRMNLLKICSSRNFLFGVRSNSFLQCMFYPYQFLHGIANVCRQFQVFVFYSLGHAFFPGKKPQEM